MEAGQMLEMQKSLRENDEWSFTLPGNAEKDIPEMTVVITHHQVTFVSPEGEVIGGISDSVNTHNVIDSLLLWDIHNREVVKS